MVRPSKLPENIQIIVITSILRSIISIQNSRNLIQLHKLESQAVNLNPKFSLHILYDYMIIWFYQVTVKKPQNKMIKNGKKNKIK